MTIPNEWDWETIYPDRFLRSDQFQGRDVTLTVTGVKLDELPGEHGKEIKAIISFAETAKQWAVNKTNKRCLTAMFGPKPNAILGKQITLFSEPAGDKTGIRIKGSPDITETITIRSSVNGKIKVRKLVPTERRHSKGTKPAPITETEQREILAAERAQGEG